MSLGAGEFWINDPSCIMGSIDFIPLPSMTLEEQLNALTRLVILLACLILPFSGTKAVLWILFGLGLIVSLFSLKIKMRRQGTSENYEPSQMRRKLPSKRATFKEEPQMIVEYYSPQCEQTTVNCVKNMIEPSSAAPKYEELEFGPSFKSWNQALVGSPAPRTTVPPILVPPPLSSEWKETSLVVRSGINTQTNQDLGRSGYIVQKDTSECGDHCGEAALCGTDIARELVESQYTPRANVVEGYHMEKHGGTNDEFLNIPRHTDISGENISFLTTDSTIPKPSKSSWNIPYAANENCGLNRPSQKKTWRISDHAAPDDILKSDGYFPEQIFENNLPSNVAFGECQKTPQMKEYNKQLYTSSLQPGVFTRNQIEEPISSNIGISFTQQFEPVTCEKDCDGVTFIGHDPNVTSLPYIKTEEILPYDRQTHLSDINDPRFTGYGTSYRSYIEPVTGQPRFYYDDVDSYKRPNYMSRSNIDHLPSSIGVQAIPSSEYFDKQNKHSRAIANEAFMNDTVSFRTDMQERLMRKGNANMAQKRRFPKHLSSFNRGGMSGRGT